MHTTTSSIQGNEHRLLYRVHDDSSAAPLTRKGFTATSPEFHYKGGVIPAEVWHKEYQGLQEVDSLVDNKHVLESIAAHVSGGWKGYHSAKAGPSDWISTSMSFQWAVWEVVRRLVILGRDSVGMSVITAKPYNPYYVGMQAVWLKAADAIEALGEKVYLTRKECRALAFARASSEVVYLGKIFERDIMTHTEWTLENLPRNLRVSMEAFFKPKKQWVRGGTWVDQLVFKPKDSYSQAAAKIQERREGLGRLRGGGQ
ncbi:uncharacterized protein MKK02DRAFT_39605 [Dioszegia hungarica]|uniref:DUF7587 domain-containing protein n=1 Tax=Dioszegia hungarica TaxID=4972 RepID=A0AA38HFP5_9TREE|nr:uncharacterized protein MKK02DRAFT_39605 [Dioszegia hungarica]KAI9639307.1 hypothetical protein MKK02DRAFT_39605 [Dioszegia hungarica]